MISILSSARLQFLNNLNNIEASLTKAQGEVSSGLAVTTASDAPDQVSAILQLHANIQQNQQVQQSLNIVSGEINTADTSLSTAISMLDNVQSLAAQGLGGSASAATRNNLASQVDGLMQQMVSISNTSVNGHYIFSGDNDQSPSYQYDPTVAGGVIRLQISSSTKQVQNGAGGSFPVSLSANQIFDVRDNSDVPATGNVFKAMNDVRTALLSNDTTALQTAVGEVTSASSYLNQQQSFYGNVENRISSALNQASSTSVSLQTDLTNRQGADQTSAILQMQQYTITLQAAIAAQSRMPTTTLFDQLR